MADEKAIAGGNPHKKKGEVNLPFSPHYAEVHKDRSSLPGYGSVGDLLEAVRLNQKQR